MFLSACAESPLKGGQGRFYGVAYPTARLRLAPLKLPKSSCVDADDSRNVLLTQARRDAPELPTSLNRCVQIVGITSREKGCDGGGEMAQNAGERE